MKKIILIVFVGLLISCETSPSLAVKEKKQLNDSIVIPIGDSLILFSSNEYGLLLYKKDLYPITFDNRYKYFPGEKFKSHQLNQNAIVVETDFRRLIYIRLSDRKQFGPIDTAIRHYAQNYKTITDVKYKLVGDSLNITFSYLNGRDESFKNIELVFKP